MRFAVCLHGAAVARSALALHPTDRMAIALGLAAGADVVVVEAVGERGSAPRATGEALEAGAHRAVRIVEPALASADAHSTGFVMATALDHLDVDLILCGDDADPEGLGDVPACVAHHMTAMYVSGALDLRAIETSQNDDSAGPATGDGGPAVDVTLRTAAWIRRVRLPLNAVVGLAGGAPVSVAPVGGRKRKRTAVQVLTLADLEIDPDLVRRRDDLRGVVEPAPRPLVTLQSAAAVAALLRGG